VSDKSLNPHNSDHKKYKLVALRDKDEENDVVINVNPNNKLVNLK